MTLNPSLPHPLSGIHMLVCTLKALRSPVLETCSCFNVWISINTFGHHTLVFSLWAISCSNKYILGITVIASGSRWWCTKWWAPSAVRCRCLLGLTRAPCPDLTMFRWNGREEIWKLLVAEYQKVVAELGAHFFHRLDLEFWTLYKVPSPNIWGRGRTKEVKKYKPVYGRVICIFFHYFKKTTHTHKTPCRVSGDIGIMPFSVCNWLIYLPHGWQAPSDTWVNIEGSGLSLTPTIFNSTFEDDKHALEWWRSIHQVLTCKWQPPGCPERFWQQRSALPPWGWSQLRAREPSGQLLHFPSCFAWVSLFTSVLSLVLATNQLKDAWKLPPLIDFHGYLVEWPLNLSSRMEFFETAWKGILSLKRRGQQVCSRYVLGNAACLVALIGKPFKAQYGMQVDSPPC